MKHFEEDFSMQNTCVAFGDFDGIHLGHRAVIDRLLAAADGLTSVLVSFAYDESLLGERKILSTEEEKKHLLAKNGPDALVSYKMNGQNKDVPVKDFIKEILVGKLGAKTIVAGKCDSNIGVLRSCADEFGYTLEEVEPVLAGGEPVCAKKIIQELAEGTLKQANDMLGHPYLLMGEVLHGKALGRTVGMPTANIGYKPNKQLPAFGVFGTISEIDGRKVKGLTNIGKRPSVDNFDYVTIEEFLLDFSGDLYGRILPLEVHAHIRGIVKFNNIEEVKQQVNKDVESIRSYFDQLVTA